MTEERLNGPDPPVTLKSIQGKITDRKLRLFTCSCLRRVWHLLADNPICQAVEEAERTAENTDGMPGDAEPWYLRLYIDPSFATLFGDGDVYDSVASILLLAAHHYADGQTASWLADHADADPLWRSYVAKLRSATAREAESSIQLGLLQDVAGILSHRVCVEPTLLRWNERIIVKLAQAAYQERQLPTGTLDKGRLAILADALEEAGCHDADILDHLRGPGPHVRGCWPVDLCLGKS